MGASMMPDLWRVTAYRVGESFPSEVARYLEKADADRMAERLFARSDVARVNVEREAPKPMRRSYR